MEIGTITRLDHRRLFGRIRPVTGGDIFFHHSGLLNRRFANLATGYSVTFRRGMDRMSGRPIALDVRVVES